MRVAEEAIESLPCLLAAHFDIVLYIWLNDVRNCSIFVLIWEGLDPAVSALAAPVASFVVMNAFEELTLGHLRLWPGRIHVATLE